MRSSRYEVQEGLSARDFAYYNIEMPSFGRVRDTSGPDSASRLEEIVGVSKVSGYGKKSVIVLSHCQVLRESGSIEDMTKFSDCCSMSFLRSLRRSGLQESWLVRPALCGAAIPLSPPSPRPHLDLEYRNFLVRILDAVGEVRLGVDFFQVGGEGRHLVLEKF